MKTTATEAKEIEVNAVKRATSMSAKLNRILKNIFRALLLKKMKMATVEEVSFDGILAGIEKEKNKIINKLAQQKALLDRRETAIDSDKKLADVKAKELKSKVDVKVKELKSKAEAKAKALEAKIKKNEKAMREKIYNTNKECEKFKTECEKFKVEEEIQAERIKKEMEKGELIVKNMKSFYGI